MGLRTVMELREIPYIGLLEVAPERKSILSSRSFERAVIALNKLKEAIATFVANAARKLRREKLKTHCLLIFISTKPLIPKQTQRLEFSQSRDFRLNLIETAPIQMNRSNAEEIKDGDTQSGKNQLLSSFGYKSETATIHLPLTTAYTPDLIKAAHVLFEGIYQKAVVQKIQKSLPGHLEVFE